MILHYFSVTLRSAQYFGLLDSRERKVIVQSDSGFNASWKVKNAIRRLGTSKHGEIEIANVTKL